MKLAYLDAYELAREGLVPILYSPEPGEVTLTTYVPGPRDLDYQLSDDDEVRAGYLVLLTVEERTGRLS